MLGIPRLVRRNIIARDKYVDSIQQDLDNGSISKNLKLPIAQLKRNRDLLLSPTPPIHPEVRTLGKVFCLSGECFTNILASVLSLYSSFHPPHTSYRRTMGCVVLYTLAISVSCIRRGMGRFLLETVSTSLTLLLLKRKISRTVIRGRPLDARFYESHIEAP